MPYRVFACGSNGNGQLGDGSFEDTSSLVPCLFKNGDLIQDTIDQRPLRISCGGNHTFLLCSGGILYSTGDNSHGQREIGWSSKLGDDGDEEDGHSDEFKRSTNYPPNIFVRHHWDGSWKTVACGWENTMALCATKDGLIAFKRGSNLKGELGSHLNKTHGIGGEFVKIGGDVVSMECGMSHTIVRAQAGGLHGWGSNSKGQLGKKAKEGSRDLDLDLEGLDTAREYHLSVARDTTMVLQPPASIKEYGRKILTGKAFDPTNKRVIDLLSMWTSVHVIYEEGGEIRIWSDGKNSHGQVLDTLVPNALKYAVGSEHGLVLTDDNRVYAWGWGEHGNCGVHDDPNNVAFTEPSLIYEGRYPVCTIEGGHATSWVVCEVDTEG